MKKDKDKKEKYHESTIGKIIYGFLLFLPLLAITTTCLVQTFNQNAKQQEEAQLDITYKYETNDVNSVSDLVVGNIYHFNIDSTFEDSNYFVSHIINLYHFSFDSLSNDIDETTWGTSEYNEYLYNKLEIGFDGVGYLILSNPSYYHYVTNFIEFNSNTTFHFEFDAVIEDVNILDIDIFNNGNNAITRCLNIPIESVEVVQEPLDENVFYRAVDRVTQSPLFNWAYNSFLVTPFAYIVNLFSMPTNSPIVMFLSYWLAISIIWLVFDLIMYVPLLVHRWLDKGVLE